MKYPKEYARKAMDILEREYFSDPDGEVQGTELLTLAAYVVGALAYLNHKEWGVDEETAYVMILQALEKPEPYDNKTTPQE